MTEFRDPKEIYREALERRPVVVEEHPPRIERAESWPYPELDRMWVRVETSPFATFPNLDFTLLGPEGEVVSTMFMIEIRNPYQSVTMHLRQPPLAGKRYRLEIVLSRDDSLLDERALDFELVYAIQTKRGTPRDFGRAPRRSQPMTDAELREIYKTAKTVAVVGISDNPERPSLGVASFLQQHGYRIVPVNPALSEVLGERSFASLREVDVPIDVVDIFRRSDAVPPIVEDAIAIGAKVVWMQEGVINEEAAKRAGAAGLQVMMDQCMKKEYRRLFE